jgi:hypothetical protein
MNIIYWGEEMKNLKVTILVGSIGIFQGVFGQPAPTEKISGSHYQYELDGKRELWKVIFGDLQRNTNLFENGIPPAFNTLIDAIQELIPKVLQAQRALGFNISESRKNLIKDSWTTVRNASQYLIQTIKETRQTYHNFAKDKYGNIVIAPEKTKNISNQVEQLIPQLQKVAKLTWAYTDIIDVRKSIELFREMAADLIKLLEKLSPQLQQLSNKIVVANKLKEQQERERKAGIIR